MWRGSPKKTLETRGPSEAPQMALTMSLQEHRDLQAARARSNYGAIPGISTDNSLKRSVLSPGALVETTCRVRFDRPNVDQSRTRTGHTRVRHVSFNEVERSSTTTSCVCRRKARRPS